MSLAIRTAGSGPDLVLLHGWGMGAGIWDELAAVLAARFRVHAVDLPGYGDSASCSPYSPERIAGELACNLPPRCGVCGWSMGGQVALAWAHRAPWQVSQLALIATTPSFVQRSDWPHAVDAAVLREFAQLLTADLDGTLRRFLALQSLGDTQARKVAAGLRAHLQRGARPPASVLADGLALLLGTDLRAMLGAIALPALVLHGDRDPLAPLAAGEFLCKALPNARLAVVKGASHAPFVSRVQETGTLLEEFFDER